MKSKYRALCMIVFTCTVAFYSMGGCVEKSAVRGLAGTKGVIETEMNKHGECNPQGANPAQTPICVALVTKAIPAQHVGVLALDAWCSSTDYLTNQKQCSPPTDQNARADLQAKLTQAVANAQAAVASVKTIAGGKP
jgi:hypothetical protein